MLQFAWRPIALNSPVVLLCGQRSKTRVFLASKDMAAMVNHRFAAILFLPDFVVITARGLTRATVDQSGI